MEDPAGRKILDKKQELRKVHDNISVQNILLLCIYLRDISLSFGCHQFKIPGLRQGLFSGSKIRGTLTMTGSRASLITFRFSVN